MALGITITPLRPAQGLFKGRKVKLVKFAGDNAKPTGGYTVTAANLHLRVIEGAVVGMQDNQNLLWALSIDSTATTVATVSTNQATLQAYTAVGSGGNATASATAVSIATVTALVYGY